MLGQANWMLVRELDGDGLGAAREARHARPAAGGLCDAAAWRRQRARVRASLLLLPRDGETGSPERAL
jgi:hypothetical protein